MTTKKKENRFLVEAKADIKEALESEIKNEIRNLLIIKRAREAEIKALESRVNNIDNVIDGLAKAYENEEFLTCKDINGFVSSNCNEGTKAMRDSAEGFNGTFRVDANTSKVRI